MTDQAHGELKNQVPGLGKSKFKGPERGRTTLSSVGEDQRSPGGLRVPREPTDEDGRVLRAGQAPDLDFYPECRSKPWRALLTSILFEAYG